LKIDAPARLDSLDFDKAGGLIPVIAQHAHTGEVLMLAYANRAALERTLSDQVMWYYSRSRGELWRKGDTSGNVQHLVSLHGDCDGDSVIARVLPDGPACHTGARNCFDTVPTLTALDAVILERSVASPAASYTQTLLADRNLRLKKLGEEALELALACERRDRESIAEEAADLLYHALVACRGGGVALGEVLAVLDARVYRAG
jgi:phosphoribosyl-AMP cyclohydrolase / phosphoribosyl-ATP pyrophosphohydrolase